MDSIKEIFKIGFGPSSSHTMGPHKAAELFAKRTPNANLYRVTLCGSLAATGKGHLTDRTIIEALTPTPTEILWRPDIVSDFHTNGMKFEALNESGDVFDNWEVFSIGGGDLSEGPNNMPEHKPVYEYSLLKDIHEYIERKGLSFWKYVQKHEDDTLWDYLDRVWKQMQTAINEGIDNDGVLPGGLHVRSKAKQYYVRANSFRDSLRNRALVSAYALATAEQNARGGKVVTAPTCGSCGVVPAVLYHLHRAHGFGTHDILKALATAGLFGNIIKHNASISGAEVGCQGEIGSACVMAAVAATQLYGGTPQQIEYAAEMAMEHNLGLTCDPVCGLVQIPCIERNAMAAHRALDVCLYVIASDGKHVISFDKVVDTMKRTGKDLPSLYKETALGGLALEED